MPIPQVRVGDFFRHEEGYSRVDKILNIDILPQDDPHDPRTHNNDAFYVEVVLDWISIWLPDKDAWTTGAKHAHHMQMSEFQHFQVFAGTKAECEAVLMQIVDNPKSVRKEGLKTYVLTLLIDARSRRIAELIDNRDAIEPKDITAEVKAIDKDIKALCDKFGIDWEVFEKVRDETYAELHEPFAE